MSLTGNRVLKPTGDWTVLLDNASSYRVLDNVFPSAFIVLSGSA